MIERNARYGAPDGAIRKLLPLLLLLLISGCGARQENLGLLEADDLYDRGVEAFEAGQHSRAIDILEFFVARHLGDPRAPEARMMLGEAHMVRRDYLTAATHFLRMLNDFPTHPRSLEARFNVCDAYYQLSPRVPLDQENTLNAMLYCESVAEYYPGTDEATQADEYVATLRYKLAEKAFDNGVWYLRRRAYDGAVVYFEQVVSGFPETNLAPAALEQLVETYEQMGYVEDAEETRERLQREYPQSPEAQAMRS